MTTYYLGKSGLISLLVSAVGIIVLIHLVSNWPGCQEWFESRVTSRVAASGYFHFELFYGSESHSEMAKLSKNTSRLFTWQAI